MKEISYSEEAIILTKEAREKAYIRVLKLKK